MKNVLKKVLLLLMVLALLISDTPIGIFASDIQSAGEIQSLLKTSYERLTEYAKINKIELGMTLEDFIGNYDGQEIYDYETIYYSLLQKEDDELNSDKSGGNNTYYYNTGLSCPSQANYNTYNLLNIVQAGDIIYEDFGGFGVTGHIAIVEGVYFKPDGSGNKYIRLIEAISNSYGGVTRSILDDTRAIEKEVTILRVVGATSTTISCALAFCQGEIGSTYNLDFAKDTSASETDWYCSELVWAAYWNQGIDLEVGGSQGEPGVTPHDILNGPNVIEIMY